MGPLLQKNAWCFLKLVQSGITIQYVFMLPYSQGRHQVKKCGVDKHGERGARAYNEGLGAEPPVGSSGRAPG